MARPELFTPPLTPERIIALSLGQQMAMELDSPIPRLTFVTGNTRKAELAARLGFYTGKPGDGLEARLWARDQSFGGDDIGSGELGGHYVGSKSYANLRLMLAHSPVVFSARRKIEPEAICKLSDDTTVVLMYPPKKDGSRVISGRYVQVVNNDYPPEDRIQTMQNYCEFGGPDLAVHSGLIATVPGGGEIGMVAELNFGNSIELRRWIQNKFKENGFDEKMPIGIDLGDPSDPDPVKHLQSVDMYAWAHSLGMANTRLILPNMVDREIFLQIAHGASEIMLGAIVEAQRLGPMKNLEFVGAGI